MESKCVEDCVSWGIYKKTSDGNILSSKYHTCITIQMTVQSNTIRSNKDFLKESDYTGAKFYYQMPFFSSSELCSRI